MKRIGVLNHTVKAECMNKCCAIDLHRQTYVHNCTSNSGLAVTNLFNGI